MPFCSLEDWALNTIDFQLEKQKCFTMLLFAEYFQYLLAAYQWYGITFTITQYLRNKYLFHMHDNCHLEPKVRSVLGLGTSQINRPPLPLPCSLL
jgi:hypothetical protein